jgi:hypothetical protein
MFYDDVYFYHDHHARNCIRYRFFGKAYLANPPRNQAACGKDTLWRLVGPQSVSALFVEQNLLCPFFPVPPLELTTSEGTDTLCRTELA